MSLIADQSNKEGKAYGQECKEIIMCLPSGRSSPPPPTVEEKEAEMEREAQKEVETVKREKMLDKRCLKKILLQKEKVVVEDHCYEVQVVA